MIRENHLQLKYVQILKEGAILSIYDPKVEEYQIKNNLYQVEVNLSNINIKTQLKNQ